MTKPNPRNTGNFKPDPLKKISYAIRLERWVIDELRRMADETGDSQSVLLRDAFCKVHAIKPPSITK